jgi:hypothetical protein
MAWNGSATTTATSMSWPRSDVIRRWLVPAAALVVIPKCVLCVLAWIGLVLGFAGPELCGVP